LLIVFPFIFRSVQVWTINYIVILRIKQGTYNITIAYIEIYNKEGMWCDEHWVLYETDSLEHYIEH